MQITKDSVVVVEYTLKDKEGTVIDSTSEEGPMAYLQGHGNLLPKFEEQLEGKAKGYSVVFTLSPEEGYGTKRPELIMDVPKSQFEGMDDLEAGMQFETDTPDGPMVLVVVAVKGDQVTVDGNSPLAGMELHFDVKVTDVRAATDEELQHGHVHGPGGHHH